MPYGGMTRSLALRRTHTETLRRVTEGGKLTIHLYHHTPPAADHP